MRVQLRHQPSFFTAPRVGEGMVFDFAGPGRVITQSRSPGAPAERVAARVPNR